MAVPAGENDSAVEKEDAIKTTMDLTYMFHLQASHPNLQSSCVWKISGCWWSKWMTYWLHHIVSTLPLRGARIVASVRDSSCQGQDVRAELFPSSCAGKEFTVQECKAILIVCKSLSLVCSNYTCLIFIFRGNNKTSKLPDELIHNQLMHPNFSALIHNMKQTSLTPKNMIFICFWCRE